MKNCSRRMGSMQTFTIRSLRMSLRNIEKRIHTFQHLHQPNDAGAVFSLWFIPDTAGCPRLLERKEKIWYAGEK